VIWANHEAEYFCEVDWTTQINLRLLRNLAFARKSYDGCNCPIVPVVAAVASIAITGLVYRLIYYVAD
jgi:hypothetical protein